jgi:trehalose synthase
MPQEIDVPIRDPEQFRDVLPPEVFEGFQRGAEEARSLLAGRAVWNVNSTARGGGVVELLRPSRLGAWHGSHARWSSSTAPRLSTA